MTKSLGFFVLSHSVLILIIYGKKIKNMMTTEFELPFLLRNFKSSLGYNLQKNGAMILEVPGFSKEDLKIELDDNVISIKGKKEILGNNYEIDKKFVINRSLVSDEPITAKVENGLLIIDFKKSEKKKQTKIEIL